MEPFQKIPLIVFKRVHISKATPIVLLIGTNNICWGSDQPGQAAMGVAAVAKKLHALYADMEILVLGVFPRRREASHPHREQIRKLNAQLPELLGPIENVTFLDIGERFLDDAGHLSEEMMPDTTHPSERGHRVWAEAIAPVLDRWLGGQESISLMQRFGHLVATMGKGNQEKARVLARAKKVKLKRGKEKQLHAVAKRVQRVANRTEKALKRQGRGQSLEDRLINKRQ